MAKPKSGARNGTRITKKMYADLQAENDALKKRVEQLTKANVSQLDRLVGEELLRIHVRELKAKIALLEDKKKGTER